MRTILNAVTVHKRVILVAMLMMGAFLGIALRAENTALAQCSPTSGSPATGVTIVCGSNDGDGIAPGEVGTFPDSVTVNAGVTVTGDIRGLEGNDTLTNNGTVTGIARGFLGDDQITNSGSLGTVDAGNGDAGKDTIINTSTGNVTGSINAFDGDDNITNQGTVGGTIAAGDGNDNVINGATASVNGSIDLGNGNDNLNNSGLINADIGGGGGDDTVIHGGVGASVVNIDLGAGNDVLTLTMGAVVSTDIFGGAAESDTLKFDMTFADPADQAAFESAFAAYTAGNPTCGTGADTCFGTISFTTTLGTFTYNFSEFEQLIRILQALAAAPVLDVTTTTTNTTTTTGGASVIVAQPLIANDKIKVFLLFTGDIDVYGGFGPSNPNGFLIGRIPASAHSGSECTRVTDVGGLNPGWYLVVCPLGNNRILVQVFDQFNTFIIEFNNPTFQTNPNQTALNMAIAAGDLSAGTQTIVAAPPSFTANPNVRPGQFGVSLGGVNLRTTPSLDGQLVGVTIPWGAFVTILEEDHSGYWFKVDYNGVVAWAANEWFAPPGQYRERGGARVPTQPQN